MVEQDELKRLFDYSDGALFWRVDRGSNKTTGLQAGYYDDRGYNRVGIGGRNYLAHRLIWAWHTGEWPAAVDHIDRNPFNNRIENLRGCSQMDNLVNSKVVRSKWGFRGVDYHHKSKLFCARITRAGETKSLGYFRSAEAAGKAYEEAHRRLYVNVFNTNEATLDS